MLVNQAIILAWFAQSLGIVLTSTGGVTLAQLARISEKATVAVLLIMAYM